jgi:hypothetical protein
MSELRKDFPRVRFGCSEKPVSSQAQDSIGVQIAHRFDCTSSRQLPLGNAQQRVLACVRQSPIAALVVPNKPGPDLFHCFNVTQGHTRDAASNQEIYYDEPAKQLARSRIPC